MRIFRGLHEALGEIERDLVEMGIQVHPSTVQNKNIADDPAYDTLEIQDYLYMLTDWSDLRETFAMHGWSWAYVEEEFKNRVSRIPLNPGSSWKLREKVWDEFRGPHGLFDYTYSERLCAQLEATRLLLLNDPDSRQGVITVYDQHQDLRGRGGLRRIPCSMHYHVLIRRDQVDMSYIMRSCDFYTHFPYDVALGIQLLEWFAKVLDMRVGFFKHYITSLHIFRKDARAGVF